MEITIDSFRCLSPFYSFDTTYKHPVVYKNRYKYVLIKHTTDSVTTGLIKAKNVFLGPKPGQSTQVITELQLHRRE